MLFISVKWLNVTGLKALSQKTHMLGHWGYRASVEHVMTDLSSMMDKSWPNSSLELDHNNLHLSRNLILGQVIHVILMFVMN